MEACRVKMEPLRVYRPVAADSYDFHEGGSGSALNSEKLDPYPQAGERLDPDLN